MKDKDCKQWAKKVLNLNAQSIEDGEYEGGVFLFQDKKGKLIERVVIGEEAEIEIPEEPGLLPIAFFHTHPDGDSNPSIEDDETMQQLADSCDCRIWLFVVGWEDDMLVMNEQVYEPRN